MLQAQLAIQKVLNEYFAGNRLRNPSYSLRAFARRLGCSSSAISEILNGKRNVSVRLAARFLGRLGVDTGESQKILALFPDKKPSRRAGTGVSGKGLSIGTAEMKNALQLQADTFALIADWFHYGILNLIMTKDFKSDPLWIAHRLAIPLQDVKHALRRLIDLKFIEVSPDGEYRRTPHALMTSDGVSSYAIRKAQGQHLELARKSLEEDPIEKRYFRFFTVALNMSHMTRLQEMIREFTENFCVLAEQGQPTEVYNIGVQFIPLTRGDPKV